MMVRQKQEVSSTNVELKYYGTAEQRPGDQHGFGFGNVQTGQVSIQTTTLQSMMNTKLSKQRF